MPCDSCADKVALLRKSEFDVRPVIGMMGWPCVGSTTDEFAQRDHGFAGQIGLGVIEPHAMLDRVTQFGQLAV